MSEAEGTDPVARVWRALHAEVVALAAGEPVLASHLHATVIRHRGLGDALMHLLSGRLATDGVPAITLREVFAEACAAAPGLEASFAIDLQAIVERDPAALGLANPFLNHKGFHALQAHRIAHAYWRRGRLALALFIQSRVSETFAVDIHPAAVVGNGVFIDHGTGVVIGETCVVEDNVSILQGVTLGGTGKDVRRSPSEDRGRRAAERRRQGARQHPHRCRRQGRCGQRGARRRRAAHHRGRHSRRGRSVGRVRRAAGARHGPAVRLRIGLMRRPMPAPC